MSRVFSSPSLVFSLAIALRVILLLYGIWQDAHSPVKYTDIDYYVFTDAVRFTADGHSPYDRDTYRYTPLLAWMLMPTAWRGIWFSFSFGKILFAAGDVVAGWLMVQLLRDSQHMSTESALRFVSIWLLNPIVATISTRGSSEGLLGAMLIALLWATTQRRIVLAGALLGLGVHFKIYPFIYAPTLVWWLDEEHTRVGKPPKSEAQTDRVSVVKNFLNAPRATLVATSLLVFSLLNTVMYSIYGWPFLQHTYLHHLTRLDHRHNFSPYNILLYLSSAAPEKILLHLETLAFIPQLLLSAILLPLVLAKKDLPSTMLAQTFAFVSFNKVCTSQYFLWYMVYLPFYLPNSSFLAQRYLGLSAATLWLITQVWWLQRAFQLEFLGHSTFVPSLWIASLLFFLTNTWILGIIVRDIGLGLRCSQAKTRNLINSSINSS